MRGESRNTTERVGETQEVVEWSVAPPASPHQLGQAVWQLSVLARDYQCLRAVWLGRLVRLSRTVPAGPGSGRYTDILWRNWSDWAVREALVSEIQGRVFA